MLHGKCLDLFQVIDRNAVDESQIGVVDRAEVGMGRQGVGNIKRNRKHQQRNCRKKEEWVKFMLHWSILSQRTRGSNGQSFHLFHNGMNLTAIFYDMKGVENVPRQESGQPAREKKTVGEKLAP